MDEQQTTASDDLVIKPVKIKARVPLTDDQWAMKDAALAEATLSLAALKAQAKGEATTARKAVKAKEELVQRLAEGEVDGREERDYQRWEVRTTRLDTAEVTTRPMSAEERNEWLDAHPPPPEEPPKQPSLPFDGADAAAAGATDGETKDGQKLVKVKRGRGRPRKEQSS